MLYGITSTWTGYFNPRTFPLHWDVKVKKYITRNVRKRTSEDAFSHIVANTRSEMCAVCILYLEMCNGAVWPVFVVRMKKFCIVGYPKNAHSEDSGKIARMRSLIRIFTGRTCQKERFPAFRLIWLKVHSHIDVF